MTTEKMLETIDEALQLVENDNCLDLLRLLKTTQLALREDVRQECQRARGNGSRDRLIRNLQKSIPAKHQDLRGWHPLKGGLHGFSDGYRLYAIQDDLGYPAAEKPRNFDICIPKNGDPVPLPVDRAEVRAYVKTEKARVAGERKARARLGPGGVTPRIRPMSFQIPGGHCIGFDPVQLLEFLEFFNADEIYVLGPRTVAQYMDPETGEWGLLVPVRLED